MNDYNTKEYFLNFISCKKAKNILFQLQNRLFKSVLLQDIKTSLKIQRLILSSNSSRLIAIRDVTQLSSKRNIAGIDGKIL
jgi:RNA-directed DNA polymerase